MNKLSIALLLIIVSGTLLLMYFFSKNTNMFDPETNTSKTSKEREFEDTISNLPSPTPAISPSEEPESTPSATNLTAAQLKLFAQKQVNSKNYKGLAPYMQTPTVTVTLQSTDCCGQLSPEDATTQMAYINQGVPFIFDQEHQTIKNIKSNTPKLSDFFIGISQNSEEVVSFKMSDEGTIVSLEMAVSHKLYSF